VLRLKTYGRAGDAQQGYKGHATVFPQVTIFPVEHTTCKELTYCRFRFPVRRFGSFDSAHAFGTLVKRSTRHVHWLP